MIESAQIQIRKLNHAFLHIQTDIDIALELSEAFKFLVDGYKFIPAYKMGKFDGYIRLFNLGNRQIASGLYSKVIEFCDKRGYTYSIIDDCSQTGIEPPDYQTPDINTMSVLEYMESLDMHTNGNPITIRDYQVEGVTVALLNRQAILKASVGAGKSMILYCVCRYITEVLGLRVLILVPTIGLTTQMRGDFADYASETDWKVENKIHLISAGADHSVKKPITISTFQSLKNTGAEWFDEFGAIITDEGHTITAASFQNIYGKATRVPFRLACTGTLHAAKCHTLTMQGLTGPIYSIAETKDLIEAGQLVPMKVKSISLNYPEDICKQFKKISYDDELHWICAHTKRNNFIKKLAITCKGTTLVFFRFTEHGRDLYDRIKEFVGDTRQVFFIDGGVSKDERESIRLLANTIDAIIVCSYGTMKMGINLPAVENIIIGHPTKGGITFLQTIGRGLRLKSGKTSCNLFDIGDNLNYKSKVNHTHRHFGDRIKALTSEGYDFTIVNVDF
jgi:superfamily II DNA or RNA helicase